MVTFVQQVEGARPTGIGSQQVVTQDNSFVRTLAGAADSFIQAGDIAAGDVAKQTAKDIVSEAQKQVDTEQAEAEEFAELEALGGTASADEISRKATLLEKGVAQGKITRENARLRVADLVTKGIEENPILSSRIRESASRLLGFNPESEAVQQFFGAFEPEGTTGSGLGAREKQAQFLSANNPEVSLQSARELIAQTEIIGLRKSLRQDSLSIGDMTADQALAEASTDDQIEGVNTMFSNALAAKRAGEEINADFWRQEATKAENSFVNAYLATLQGSGLPVTSATVEKARQDAKVRYESLVEDISEFDTAFLNKQNLDRLVTAQKVFGAQAMPTFTFLVNNFGERTAGSLIDLMANVGGKPERLQALLGASPGLAPLVNILNQDPQRFNQLMTRSVSKLADPAAPIEQEDLPAIDLFLNEIVKFSPPPERQGVIDQLRDKGMPSKGTSILSEAGRTGATPKEVSFMKGEWNLSRETLPGQIAEDILAGNIAPTRTNRGASIEVTPDGTLTVMMRKPDGSLDPQRFNHPAWNNVQKLNVFLKSTDKGWAQDLGIPDKMRTAEGLKSIIDQQSQTAEEFNAQLQEESEAFNNARERFNKMTADQREKELERLRAKAGR